MEDRTQQLVEASGGTSSAVDSLRVQQYRKPLRKMRWFDVRTLLHAALAGWTRHNPARMGAAVAFYTLLSLMPLLLVAISIAGLVLGPHAAAAGIVNRVQLLVGDQRARIIQTLLDGVQNRTDGLLATIFGILTLMFGATGLLTELRDELNTIWEVPSPPVTILQGVKDAIRDRLRSLLLVLAIVVLLSISLLLGTWISALGTLASVVPAHEAVLHVLNGVFSFVAIAVLFGAIYKVVPAVPIKWPDVVLGAIVTSVLFTAGNLLLGLYLGKAFFTSTYGAAASTIVLGVWAYYSSQVFFLGAEFTKAFAQCYGSAPTDPPPDPTCMREASSQRTPIAQQ
jgi:membrane protein